MSTLLPVPHKGQVCCVRAFKNRTNSVLIPSEQKNFNLQPDLHQSTTTCTEYCTYPARQANTFSNQKSRSHGREENLVVCFHLYLMALTVKSWSPHANVVGSFRDDDGDGKREQEKSNRLNQVKTKVLHAQNTFLYISVPSFHDYKVKFPLQATFYGGIKKA